MIDDSYRTLDQEANPEVQNGAQCTRITERFKA